MVNVLYLSISGVFYAIRYAETPLVGLGELFFVNHPKEVLHVRNAELAVAAGSEFLLTHVLKSLAQADENGRVAWAQKKGDDVACRTWRQLNNFLRRHGLVEVEEDDQYTTGRARDRVLEVNPDLQVFA